MSLSYPPEDCSALPIENYLQDGTELQKKQRSKVLITIGIFFCKGFLYASHLETVGTFAVNKFRADTFSDGAVDLPSFQASLFRVRLLTLDFIFLLIVSHRSFL